MLSTPYEAFHLGLVLGNLCGAGGQNRSDQLVYRRLFSYKLLLFLNRQLNKVMNENPIGALCLG
jgi:hypothetical protein